MNLSVHVDSYSRTEILITKTKQQKKLGWLKSAGPTRLILGG